MSTEHGHSRSELINHVLLRLHWLKARTCAPRSISRGCNSSPPPRTRLYSGRPPFVRQRIDGTGLEMKPGTLSLLIVLLPGLMLS